MCGTDNLQAQAPFPTPAAGESPVRAVAATADATTPAGQTGGPQLAIPSPAAAPPTQPPTAASLPREQQQQQPLQQGSALSALAAAVPATASASRPFPSPAPMFPAFNYLQHGAVEGGYYLTMPQLMSMWQHGMGGPLVGTSPHLAYPHMAGLSLPGVDGDCAAPPPTSNIAPCKLCGGMAVTPSPPHVAVVLADAAALLRLCGDDFAAACTLRCADEPCADADADATGAVSVVHASCRAAFCRRFGVRRGALPADAHCCWRHGDVAAMVSSAGASAPVCMPCVTSLHSLLKALDRCVH